LPLDPLPKSYCINSAKCEKRVRRVRQARSPTPARENNTSNPPIGS
jgi:hypothetical protein